LIFFSLFFTVGDLGVSDENVEHLCWGTGASPVHSENQLSKAEDGVLGLVIGGGNEMSESQQQTKQAAQTDEQQEQDDNEDSQEPLALLVIHAAMHMLFLPQFTCDFYEEDEEDSTKRQEEQRQTKDDRDMRNEVGLGPTKKVEAGVLLVPRPTSIVWTVGAGFVPKVKYGSEGGTIWILVENNRSHSSFQFTDRFDFSTNKISLTLFFNCFLYFIF
jgi:hypothetical protein